MFDHFSDNGFNLISCCKYKTKNQLPSNKTNPIGLPEFRDRGKCPIRKWKNKCIKYLDQWTKTAANNSQPTEQRLCMSDEKRNRNEDNRSRAYIPFYEMMKCANYPFWDRLGAGAKKQRKEFDEALAMRKKLRRNVKWAAVESNRVHSQSSKTRDRSLSKGIVKWKRRLVLV